MEDLFVYMILLYEELVTENEYNEKLDELFLGNPENDDLLYLEWETDIEKAIVYVRTHMDYNNLDPERFGEILMSKLKTVYINCSDIKHFANRMYSLWESLPGNIQDIEPFWTLSYADDPLSWGDEEQTRSIYEHMLNYYDKDRREENKMNDNFSKMFSKKQETSEKLKAKQYGAATLICVFAVILMTVISLIWGDTTFGSGRDEVPLGFVIFCVRNVVLLFGGIDLISAAYHYVLWTRKGKPCMEDDNNSLLSDWNGGERSPAMVSLVLTAGIIVLALLLVMQG